MISYRQFGIQGGAYDFESIDLNELQKKKKQLDERFTALKRHVNIDVIETFDR